MRTDIWYPLLGFLVASSLVQLTVAVVHVPGRVQPWVTWGGGVLAAALSLTAGIYATRGTWIESLLVWALHLHPLVPLVVGVGFIVLVWRMLLAAAPDQYVSLTLTSGLISAAFFLPLLAEHAVPPGQVADLARQAVDNAAAFTVDLTAGWF